MKLQRRVIGPNRLRRPHCEANQKTCRPIRIKAAKFCGLEIPELNFCLPPSEECLAKTAAARANVTFSEFVRVSILFTVVFRLWREVEEIYQRKLAVLERFEIMHDSGLSFPPYPPPKFPMGMQSFVRAILVDRRFDNEGDIQ